MNTCSPQTIGDDQPRPATSIFQATFSFVLQRSGRFGLSATPSAPGPRNCGQFMMAAWAVRDNRLDADMAASRIGKFTRKALWRSEITASKRSCSQPARFLLAVPQQQNANEW